MSEVTRTKGPAEGDDETPGGSDIMSREGRALSAVLGMPVDAINYGEVMYQARVRIAGQESDLESSRAALARMAEGLRGSSDREAARFGWESVEYWRRAMEREYGDLSNASEFQREQLRIATELCFLLASPDAQSAQEWLSAQKRGAVRKAARKLTPVIANALSEYVTQGLRYDEGADVEGGGMRLVDVFTAPGEETIETGQRELELLADELDTAIYSALSAPASEEGRPHFPSECHDVEMIEAFNAEARRGDGY